MTKYFRDAGFENVAQVSHTLLSGVVLSGQGTNTTIYLLGANAHANTTLKENNNNGSVIAYIPAGNNNFPCTVACTGNRNIFSTANDAISLFYYVESGTS
jgi:Na+-transporting NADH:ubiquinone oxidoreductase subunit NqrA